MKIETGRQRNPPDFIIREGIETKKRKAKVKNLHGIKKKAIPKECLPDFKQKVFERKKYTIGTTDSDGSPVIEMLNTVQNAGSAAVQQEV